MVVYESVLVDSDILIKAYRGELKKQHNLKLLKEKYCISVITACELLNGAKNLNQRKEFNKLLRYYYIVFVDEKISEIAFSIYKKYSYQNNVKISDAFIAATAIRNNLELYTDNKKHFDFIEGINFYKEK
ncbi:MAG: type II toxin-antitoxin system VapC family toxin [Chitinophagaceae bacterium]